MLDQPEHLLIKLLGRAHVDIGIVFLPLILWVRFVSKKWILMLLLLLLYSIEVLCELLRRQSFSIEPWVSHYIIDIVAICVIKLKHVKQKISNTFFRHLGPLVYLGIVNWISFSTWHLNGVFRFISVLIQAKSTIPTVH